MLIKHPLLLGLYEKKLETLDNEEYIATIG